MWLLHEHSHTAASLKALNKHGAGHKARDGTGDGHTGLHTCRAGNNRATRKTADGELGAATICPYGLCQQQPATCNDKLAQVKVAEAMSAAADCKALGRCTC
jgi:hypothetical protein